MKKRIQRLIANDLGTILGDAFLSKELLLIWSQLTGKRPCITCAKEHSRYYNYIRNQGLTQIKNMENRKYELQGTIIVFGKAKKYNTANTTDAECIELIKKNPRMHTHFSKLPENWKAECEVKGDVSNEIKKGIGKGGAKVKEVLKNEVPKEQKAKSAIQDKTAK